MIGTNLKGILEKRNMKVIELSKLSGVKSSRLKSILADNPKKIHEKTMNKICVALKIKPSELTKLHKAIIREEPKNTQMRIRVSEAEKNKIRDCASQLKITEAEVMRRGIDALIEEEQTMSPRTGRPTDDPKTISRRVMLSKNDKEKLRLCSKSLGITEAEVLRRGIDALINVEEPKTNPNRDMLEKYIALLDTDQKDNCNDEDRFILFKEFSNICMNSHKLLIYDQAIEMRLKVFSTRSGLSESGIFLAIVRHTSFSIEDKEVLCKALGLDKKYLTKLHKDIIHEEQKIDLNINEKDISSLEKKLRTIAISYNQIKGTSIYEAEMCRKSLSESSGFTKSEIFLIIIMNTGFNLAGKEILCKALGLDTNILNELHKDVINEDQIIDFNSDTPERLINNINSLKITPFKFCDMSAGTLGLTESRANSKHLEESIAKDFTSEQPIIGTCSSIAALEREESKGVEYNIPQEPLEYDEFDESDDIDPSMYERGPQPHMNNPFYDEFEKLSNSIDEDNYDAGNKRKLAITFDGIDGICNRLKNNFVYCELSDNILSGAVFTKENYEIISDLIQKYKVSDISIELKKNRE